MFRKIACALLLTAIAAPALAGTPRLNVREHIRHAAARLGQDD